MGVSISKLFWAGALAWAGVTLAAEPALTADDFFDDKVLQEVRLYINPDDWRKLQANAIANTYYTAELVWRGQSVGDIGIRSRGRGSRSGIKPGIHVDFNRFEEDQAFLGLGKVELDNISQDTALLRERLSMLIMKKMGVPAPREAHAKLYINDKYFGLYGIVESIDKRFLKRTFNEDNGYLYEFKPLTEGYRFQYLGPEVEKYSPIMWDPSTNESKPEPTPIEAMIRAINQSSDAEFSSAVGKYLNLKEFMVHIAVEMYLAEFDGILGDVFGMNNFQTYRLEGKTLHRLIAWDKDNAFSWHERPLFVGVNDNVLSRRAMLVPELKAAYLDALIRTAAYVGGAGGWLDQELTRAYDQIRDAAREDKVKLKLVDGDLKPSSNEDFEASVAYLRQFAQTRSGFVRSTLAGTGFEISAGAPQLNGAAGDGYFSAGAAVSLSGSGFGDSATALTVLINGFAATITAVDDGQVSVTVPDKLRPGAVPVTLLKNGLVSNTITVEAF
ncbi:MAG: hypothetical protein EXQ52_14355 [Bryobacterales bacterium]|nr:hypothetical protein [Bryobacterales bacterium]